ncbi:MAG: DUF692 domain-containing protein [Bdellovibrionales bacterium]|nr:DUF692 domain-containing protein [Bdellovibrionales bacterium]
MMGKQNAEKGICFSSSMINGTGIGFRRDLAQHILDLEDGIVRFVEFAPENWMQIGGRWGKVLAQLVERYPITCHGLSLSLGSPEALDWNFLKDLKEFFKQVPVTIYSEHLSYSKCDNAHLYELLPIPFREDAARHVASRIRQVQDFLERRIAIENVSYYTPIAPQISEADFLTLVLEEADCDLLLDVNNVYVNAFNHRYDAKEFLSKIPLDRVAYIHMAGHEQREPDLIIDTHAQPIIDPVYDLFEWALARIQPVPVLLERDFNFPEFKELVSELSRLQEILDRQWGAANAA